VAKALRARTLELESIPPDLETTPSGSALAVVDPS